MIREGGTYDDTLHRQTLRGSQVQAAIQGGRTPAEFVSTRPRAAGEGELLRAYLEGRYRTPRFWRAKLGLPGRRGQPVYCGDIVRALTTPQSDELSTGLAFRFHFITPGGLSAILSFPGLRQDTIEVVPGFNVEEVAQ